MARHIGRAGLDLIRSFEQFRPNPYRDAVGIWTIGFGAIRGLDGQPVAPTTPRLSPAEADALLERDAGRATGAVNRLIVAPSAQAAFDALCSFTFNLGAGALQRSTLRQTINRCEAAEEELWVRWDMAGGKHLPGLRRRRIAEWSLYADNAVWQAAAPSAPHRSGSGQADARAASPLRGEHHHEVTFAS